MDGLQRKGMGNCEAQNTSTFLLQSFRGESISTAKMQAESNEEDPFEAIRIRYFVHDHCQTELALLQLESPHQVKIFLVQAIISSSTRGIATVLANSQCSQDKVSFYNSTTKHCILNNRESKNSHVVTLAWQYQSMKQSQSVWMSHWTHTSCRKANEAPKRLGDDSGEVSDGRKQHQSLSGPELERCSSEFVGGFGDLNKGKGIDFMKDNRTMSSKKLRNEVFEGQSSFPVFKPSQDRDSVLSQKNGVSLGRTADYLSLMPGQAPPEVEIQKRKPQFQTEDINLAPEKRVKSNSLLERSSRVVSTPIQDDFVRSTAVTVPCEFEGRRAPIQSFFYGLDHINEPGCASLVHKKKMNKNDGLLFCDPSTSNNQLRDFFGKSFQTVPNHSDFELFSSQISPRDNIKLEKLYQGSYALPSLPSVHDVETMRMRATIDSREEFSRGPPKFTQTTHRFFITKKTDVNLPDGAQMFRESATSNEFKGKMVTGLLALSPDFGFHVKQGEQMQPLGSSTKNEGKENTGNVKASAVVEENDSSADGIENTENFKTSAVDEENDSSAETDAMDIHALCENHISGVASLQSHKVSNFIQLYWLPLATQGIWTSARAKSHQLLKLECLQNNRESKNSHVVTLAWQYQSMKQSQSVWMSHWTHTSCRKANEAPKRLGDDSGEVSDGRKQHQSLSGPELERCSSEFVGGFGDLNKGKGIDFMKDNRTMSSKKLRNEVFEGQSSFPVFKPSQDRDSVLSQKNGVSLGRTADYLSLMPGQAPPEVEIQKRKPQFQTEDINLAPEKRVKSNSLLERSSRVVSTPIQDDFVRSTAVTVPCEFEGRRAPIQSFFYGLDHINEPGCASLVHKKKMNKNDGLLFCDPSTSNNQLRDFFGKSFQTVPNHSDFELFSSQISPRDNIKLEKLYQGSYALPSLPSVHDVETMRMRATIDSREEFSRGPPKFTQTTHRFFITKKTDVNLPDGAQMFRESATSNEFKGKMVTGLLALSPDFGFHVKQGEQMQPLGSSTKNEGKENTGNVKASAVVEENDSSADGIENTENFKTSAVDEENDSSAETDAMDIHALCENHISGVASLQSHKDISEGQKSPASQAGVPPVRQETKGRQINTELPDIKQELPVLPGVARSPDDMETSTSRTQSLDVECFLPHPEHSTNSKSSDCHNAPSRLDPYSRWVKRLKPSASDSFGYDTQSSKVEEASSRRKFNKLISKMPRHRKSISEPKKSKSCGKEQAVTDQTAESPRNSKSYSTDSARKSQEITLSHAWVQRWCHKPSASPKKKPKAMVVSEPECSVATLDFQNKQFASIAAMALMGKAMNGFRPCEFRKRGSSVIWNTRGFRDELS
ncbi:hypothetical protein NC651_022762 [Populus alba x Populus x berolinensis]|nr:hypothetical protein NC651_022762 [Populus alba x Populus x berolinensis]